MISWNGNGADMHTKHSMALALKDRRSILIYLFKPDPEAGAVIMVNVICYTHSVHLHRIIKLFRQITLLFHHVRKISNSGHEIKI